MSRQMLVPNRSDGGRRWTEMDDSRLLEMVKSQVVWTDIAAALNRTFSAVQNRFRFLKSLPENSALEISPRVETRAQERELEPDLSCGAMSVAARQFVQQLWAEILRVPTRRHRLPAKVSDEAYAVTGALIREALQMHWASGGWIRVTVSRVRSVDFGLARESFRSIVECLEECSLLERHVGYLGAPSLGNSTARRGRSVLLRASRRLVELGAQHGITQAVVATHFPSLRS